MVVPVDGVGGNPDWLREVSFAGGVVISDQSASITTPKTYGPIYTGDAQSVGLVFNQTNPSRAWNLELQYSPDGTFGIGTIFSDYNGVQNCVLTDFVENIAPFLKVKVSPGSGAGNLTYGLTMWKSQTIGGTVVPGTRGVMLSIGSTFVAAGGSTSVVASNLVPGPAIIAWLADQSQSIVEVQEAPVAPGSNVLYCVQDTGAFFGRTDPFNIGQNQIGVELVAHPTINTTFKNVAIISGNR